MNFKEWLEKKDMSIKEFYDAHRCACTHSLYKYKDGETPTKFVAKKIVKATKGQVTLEDLGVK